VENKKTKGCYRHDRKGNRNSHYKIPTSHNNSCLARSEYSGAPRTDCQRDEEERMVEHGLLSS